MTDFRTASVDDTAMTILQMLENKDNWDYAAQLIAMGELPISEFDAVAKAFPDFWLEHCIPNGSA